MLTLEEAICQMDKLGVTILFEPKNYGPIAGWLKELKEMREQNSKLEKEADWLAHKLPEFCQFLELNLIEKCPFSGECPIGGLSYCPCASQEDWRIAARREVEEQCKS